MRQIFLFLAATGCAYQDDDGWDAVDKACADAPWTSEGWDADTLPEPLASDEACQRVLAEHTGADALGTGAEAVRDQIVWSAWTLALAPMKGPAPGDTGAGPARTWSNGGQPAVYEEVVQRLSEAEAVSEQAHELSDGVWGAVRGLDDNTSMLPVMVHESAHWRRPGHDPCVNGDRATGRPCDTSYDSPTGWEAAVATLLFEGLIAADDSSGLLGRMGSLASDAAGAVQERTGVDPQDEDDGDGAPIEGIE
jgi:hypothetical protein